MLPKAAYASPEVRKLMRRLDFRESFSGKEEADRIIYNSMDLSYREGWLEEYKSLDRFHQEKGVESILFWDPDYPSNLKEIHDPPLVLFCLGNRNLTNLDWVAVVGTRKASPVTLEATKKLIQSYLPKDVGIVSGMALGVDRKAMLQSLSMGKPTMGVLGTAIDMEYPFENKDLYRKMKSGSNTILLTEYLPNTKYSKWTFPMRNRIITGISQKVYLMEAPIKSGGMSSAHSAISQNRDLYVFDHEYVYNNEGGRSLIEEGATALEWKELSPDTSILHGVKDKKAIIQWMQSISGETVTTRFSEWEFRGKLLQLVNKGIAVSLGDDHYILKD